MKIDKSVPEENTPKTETKVVKANDPRMKMDSETYKTERAKMEMLDGLTKGNDDNKSGTKYVTEFEAMHVEKASANYQQLDDEGKTLSNDFKSVCGEYGIRKGKDGRFYQLKVVIGVVKGSTKK